MRIAILGTRGVPARYSGFETCAEELGSRLASRGHDVTVYCRNQYLDYPHSAYKGMKLVKIPTIKNKYLDSMVHTLISCLHAAPRRYDVIFMMIVGNSPTAIVPRKFEPGFKVFLMNKDLDTFNTIAKELHVPVSFSNVAQRYQQAALAAGLGDMDTSVVQTLIEKLAAVEFPKKG